MDRVHTSRSIREREQKVFGNYSFLKFVTLDKNEAVALRQADGESPPKKRRAQVIQAQRNHRTRMRDYMTALEGEVQRLRDEHARLSQTSSDWQRCAVAIIHPSRDTLFLDHWISQMEPGTFIWTVTDANNVNGDVAFSLKQLTLAMFPTGFMTSPASVEIYDSSVRELLFNFYENIIPALGHGYAKHILPLSIESEMVRNALLAASASHMKGIQATMILKSLGYRTAAIRGLQQASKKLPADTKFAPFILATILGLLIDDMINENEDFSPLVKMAHSWIKLNPSSNDGLQNPLRRFLLGQIQMIKTLVHPLYKFKQAYNPTKKAFSATSILPLPSTQIKLCDIFASLEAATVQACSIYNFRPSLNRSEIVYGSSTDLDDLLDNLRSTVSELPPYAPGENTLVWVYSIGASRSTRAEHVAFFMSRLAELLNRIGYHDIPGYLSTISMY